MFSSLFPEITMCKLYVYKNHKTIIYLVYKRKQTTF